MTNYTSIPTPQSQILKGLYLKRIFKKSELIRLPVIPTYYFFLPISIVHFVYDMVEMLDRGGGLLGVADELVWNNRTKI